MAIEKISWKTLVFISLLCSPFSLTHAQTNAATAQIRPALQILDTTKDQDGLVGSVRRVKTEYARINLKNGQPIEGPRQLLEVTTYGVKGNRLDNVSYPIAGSTVGREEYKYDSRGNIIEKILRDDAGVVLSREAYDYVFDDIGNWVKMTTSLVVVENGELKQEPTEVTYRTLTYYASDAGPAAAASESRVVSTRERTEKLSDAAPERKPESDAPKTADPQARQPHTGIGAESTEDSKNESGSSLTPTTEMRALVPSPTAEIVAARPRVSADAYSSRRLKAPDVGIVSDPAPPPRQPKGADTPRSLTANSDSSKNSETERATALSVGNTAASTAPPPAGANKALEMYKIGRQRFDVGDVNAAIDAYLESVRIEPASAEVQLNLGLAYLTIKKDKDAMKAFKQAVHLNPELAEAYYGLGFVSFRAAKFTEAMDAFKRAIALIPDMAKAHYGLALAYIELQKLDDMIQEYRILQRLDGKLAAKLSQAFPDVARCTGTRYCR